MDAPAAAAPAAAAENPEGRDAVTLVQDQVAAVCAACFNFVGALQRDAPPRPLGSEPLAAPPAPPGPDVAAQVEVMSAEMAGALKRLHALISALPGPGAGEAAELADAAAAAAEDAAELEGLKTELAAARARLRGVEDAHAALAERALRVRGGGGTGGAPPA
jgi:hypothetical protein